METKKVALITGGARGIGKAIVLMFARQGYDVVINYFGSEEKAKQVEQECRSFGAVATTYRCNVASKDEVESMIEYVMQTYGRIDVLINNAGITKDGLVLRMTEDDFDAVLNTNLKGTFLCCKYVSRYMLKQKHGVIVNLSSVIGVVGNVGQANYASSKAGVIGLSKSLAKEFASRNIRVNAIAPGYIVSDMSEVLNETTKQQIMQSIPMKTFGNVDDVANVVKFLSSEDARYITGQVIHVDGGMVM